MAERHLIACYISGDELADLLQRTMQLTDEPIPDDARYLRAYFDVAQDRLTIIYEHPTFPRVALGAQPIPFVLVRKPDVERPPASADPRDEPARAPKYRRRAVGKDASS